MHRTAVASIRDYLEHLRESGVEGVPVAPSLSGGMDAPLPRGMASAPSAPPEGGTAAAPAGEREPLDRIAEGLGDCTRCKLAESRQSIVFGTGNPQARLVFVGEGPGADEDRQGVPFVGAAGQLLNRVITAMGLARDDVYICNIVKCRPPGNREPEPDEIAACFPFLLRQLASVNPEVIVALGRPAAHALLGVRDPISRLRGTFRDFRGTPLMPTYHPSYLLRKQAENDLGPFWDVWDDMTQVLRLLNLPVPEKSRKKQPR